MSRLYDRKAARVCAALTPIRPRLRSGNPGNVQSALIADHGAHKQPFGHLCKNEQPSEQPPKEIGLSLPRGKFRYKVFILLVPGGGVEPPRPQGSADFESAASASSAIPAFLEHSNLSRLAMLSKVFLDLVSHRPRLPWDLTRVRPQPRSSANTT